MEYNWKGESEGCQYEPELTKRERFIRLTERRWGDDYDRQAAHIWVLRDSIVSIRREYLCLSSRIPRSKGRGPFGNTNKYRYGSKIECLGMGGTTEYTVFETPEKIRGMIEALGKEKQ